MTINRYMAAVLALVWAVAEPGWGEVLTISGTPGSVVEAIDAGGYTYVKVNTATGMVWAATTTFPVKVGDDVVIPPGGLAMKDFESPTLGRKFDWIFFVGMIRVETAGGDEPAVASVARPAPPPGEAMPGSVLPATHPPVHGGRLTPIEAEEVGVIEPAKGGIRIAKLYAGKRELVGKPVTVRGRVVKFNAKVMNRNWIHLQDGSGTAQAGTHDLTLTTDATVAVGDLITVTGVLALDRDFGFGYLYPVLVEDATIVD